MGWTIYYQVVRAHRLDERELAAVAALEREVNAEPWDAEAFGLAIATVDTPERIIARGSTKLAMSLDESEDADRICDALTRLQRLVADAEVRATDDLGMLVWDDAEAFALGGRGSARPLVEPEGDAGWKGLRELVPPPGPTLKKKVAAALAAHAADALGEAARRDRQVIQQALELAARRDGPRDAAKALLAACDPDVVARTAFEIYPRIQHGYEAGRALDAALGRVTDPVALAPAFLEMWAHPKGIYYYGDLPLPDAFAAAIASVPEVEARLIADLPPAEAERAPEEIVSRRAARAIELLARSRRPAARRCLVVAIRRWRAAARVPHHVVHRVLLPAIKHLARWPTVEVAPTLALVVDGSSFHWGADRDALEGLAQVRPELARPLVEAVLAAGLAPHAALAAAATLRDATLLGEVALYLAYPCRSVRRSAEAAVEAITGTRPAPREVVDADADPEPHVLHRDREVRHRALRALGDRADPATFESLVVAERIDRLDQQARGFAVTVPIDWRPWKDLLPPEVVEDRRGERYRWARAEAELALGPQQRLDVVAPWWDEPAAAVAAMGPVRVALDPATRAAAERDELTALAALEAEAAAAG
jgi:hypothetical protein